MTERQHGHVVVSVESGSAAQEELAVEDVGDGRYRLVVAPALTVGLAKGDLFEIERDSLRPRVVQHGGNLTSVPAPAFA